MRDVMRRHRPDVVFHAAAHKHVPMLETNPRGRGAEQRRRYRHGRAAALAAGVPRFVNISTDKAVMPASMLGVTKALAERVIRALSLEAGDEQAFVSVRFGNVLGSRGSVVPLFTEQIRRGGPVTVTDRDTCRYFMTIPEAARLVIQAGALGENGAVYVLDMGEPVRIMDLAADMIRLSGADPRRRGDRADRPASRREADRSALHRSRTPGPDRRRGILWVDAERPSEPEAPRARSTNWSRRLSSGTSVEMEQILRLLEPRFRDARTGCHRRRRRRPRPVPLDALSRKRASGGPTRDRPQMIDLRGFMGVIRGRKWSVLIVTVLVAGLALGARVPSAGRLRLHRPVEVRPQFIQSAAIRCATHVREHGHGARTCDVPARRRTGREQPGRRM